MEKQIHRESVVCISFKCTWRKEIPQIKSGFFFSNFHLRKTQKRFVLISQKLYILMYSFRYTIYSNLFIIKANRFGNFGICRPNVNLHLFNVTRKLLVESRKSQIHNFRSSNIFSFEEYPPGSSRREAKAKFASKRQENSPAYLLASFASDVVPAFSGLKKESLL